MVQTSPRWTLENFKAEALDAFGLLDISIDEEMQEDNGLSPIDNNIYHLK